MRSESGALPFPDFVGRIGGLVRWGTIPYGFCLQDRGGQVRESLTIMHDHGFWNELIVKRGRAPIVPIQMIQLRQLNGAIRGHCCAPCADQKMKSRTAPTPAMRTTCDGRPSPLGLSHPASSNA